MSNPDSRRIFYFLVLNLSYMMIQMLYGIWTNSLGLISDGMWSESRYHHRIAKLIHTAIHMGFDCMAIGMGLFASVMATWPPNERFTYGSVALSLSAPLFQHGVLCFRYGRIETLSGFANGIFLILISIFIIFEAIQRL